MKVMVGLSGGVDSAIAAYLVKKQGYEVVAGFMRNWDALANNDYLGNPTLNDSACPQEVDYQDAVKVAEKLNIPLLRIDFVKQYWDSVFSMFLEEYKKGRTPNPDVFCNKYIKFDSFLDFARENGCDAIVMGHYAKKGEYNGHTHILKAADKNKDQSYFLSQINEEQISSCIFPLGDLLKPEVRKLARELDLTSVAEKKDSTGVCFIGERHFREFLSNYLPAQKGDIIDGESNKVIGTHKGALFYTLGQRHGLGIGGISGEEGGAYFVYKKDIKNNVLYVAKGKDNKLLLSNSCLLDNINWIGDKPITKEVGVKFRYRQADQKATLFWQGGNILLSYPQGVPAVTPGQVAAIYDGEVLLGSGIISATFSNGNRIDIQENK